MRAGAKTGRHQLRARGDNGDGVAGCPEDASTTNRSGGMPIEIAANELTLLIRKSAFERAGLTRAEVDAKLNLTPEEFRMEGDLIAIGPLPPYGWLEEFVTELEGLGLLHFDDFFDLSGNWPEWLTLYARGG